jgi:hypothetical protein|tara:strand:+ start:2046 stop:2309 length:264 start_codon:yes stop_codon:yes gene_type:complete
MATIASISLDVKKIDKSKLKDGRYLNLDLSIRDELNQYGQNVSVYYNRSKEERDQEMPKSYLGNGKVVWTDGNISTGKSSQQETVDF